MEFRETLLAAQRNQQQKSSESCYYKARFDPPKKEQKRDRLSANIQKFLAKKEEEEKQKKLEAQKKREELIALRDPKALRKIQKTLKVIKSANKSVLADAVDRDNTAVTREGPDMPDQDDYGYESQEAAALYEKMMQKYSKIPDEPKFPTGNNSVKKDLNGTRERVKHALQHEDEPVPHKRRRRGDKETDRDLSPPTKYEPERKESKPDKPKFRKPAPPPMDFNQLLKLAEQKKSEPLEVAQKKEVSETNTAERLMTKKQKREYEEEMARRQRRQERIDAEKSGNRKVQKEERPSERERKPEPSGFGRIPKLSDKNSNTRNLSPRPTERVDKTYSKTQAISRNSPKLPDRDQIDRQRQDRDRVDKQREKDRAKNDKDKMEREKERIDRERLERLKAERERIDRDIERLNKDRDKIDKTKNKLESVRQDKSKIVDRTKLNSKDSVNKSIDLKSQNTYRIDKNSNEKKSSVPSKNSDGRYNMNGQNSQGKPVPKLNKEQGMKNGVRDKPSLGKVRDGSPRVENGKKILSLNKGQPPKRPEERRPPGKTQAGAGPSKAVTSSFDFDKHVSSLKKNGLDKNGGRPGDGKRRPHPDDKKNKRRAVHSDSEYDSEMDDFIDDGDENMDYSTHIKEIFGYDKSKYRDMDDDDDPDMESSFARQQREEYISKKIGIMEDLEDMRQEAMEKKKSKKRRISDD